MSDIYIPPVEHPEPRSKRWTWKTAAWVGFILVVLLFLAKYVIIRP